MKVYMGYSHSVGACEGAALIFANNAKEARKLAWKSVVGTEITDDWVDVRVKLIKDSPWLFKEMLRPGPHFNDNPRVCTQCECWGYEIGDDGICSACRENNIVNEELKCLGEP